MPPSSRRLFISYYDDDPDATDCSSEEDLQNADKGKRRVLEVDLQSAEKGKMIATGVDLHSAEKEKRMATGEELETTQKEKRMDIFLEKRTAPKVDLQSSEKGKGMDIFLEERMATDVDPQSPEKEKGMVMEVDLETMKERTSRYPGVRRRPSGSWEAEIHDPGAFDTEEAAYEAYKTYRAGMMAGNTQSSVSGPGASSSPATISCVSSSASCEQKALEEADRLLSVDMEADPVGESSPNSLPVEMEIDPVDESSPNVLSSTHSVNEISADASLGQQDELLVPVTEYSYPSSFEDEFPRLARMFQASDNFSETEYDYMGLPDLSHLPLPMEEPDFDVDAYLNWDNSDFNSILRELDNS